MLTAGIGYLVMAFYVARRIVYYRRALEFRRIAEIIDGIQLLKGVTLRTEYSAAVLLDTAHKVCSGVQRRITRDKRPCLIRALVLYEICMRQGIDAGLVIGAGKVNHSLEGHAWLELDGVPYRDKQNLDDYVEMIRYVT